MFRPEHIDLPAAKALVRKRLGLTEVERDTIDDAVREGALTLRIDVDGELIDQAPGWLAITDVWWPHPFVNTQCKPHQVSCYSVMVRTLDIDRLWPDPAAIARAGGPKSKHDWEGAILELARLELVEGTQNKIQADLVRHLQDWFIARTGSAPAASDIKARVKKFQDTVRTAT